MIRAVADRAFLPAKSLFEQVGDMMTLTSKTVISAVRPPYPYGGEFIGQFLFALQLCWFPMMVSMIAVSFGAPGLQAANFLTLFGALDRLGGFFATLFNNASVTDLWGSVLKCSCFGAIIAIVCSYKGMTASGGAEGVGRAVNEAVVIAFMGVFAFNYVFTQTLLATHPELQVIK
jgi:ABC-type transporter Mla maintaining outer membrane lipid asymmetry permease subunit MlaE